MNEAYTPKWVSKLDEHLCSRWRRGELPEKANIPPIAETLARVAEDASEDAANKLVGAGNWPVYAIRMIVRCSPGIIGNVATIAEWLSIVGIVTKVVPRLNIVYVTLPAEAIYYVACDERVENLGEEEVRIIAPA